MQMSGTRRLESRFCLRASLSRLSGVNIDGAAKSLSRKIGAFERGIFFSSLTRGWKFANAPILMEQWLQRSVIRDRVHADLVAVDVSHVKEASIRRYRDALGARSRKRQRTGQSIQRTVGPDAVAPDFVAVQARRV